MSDYRVTILGAGLAGCEAALWLAGKGVQVDLYEQKPVHFSPAHKSEGFAELICSNSLKAERLDSASGLLKEEMRRMGSRLLTAAEETRVAAGGALAVDRDAFSAAVTRMVEQCENITVHREQVETIDESAPILVATGPLTDGALADEIGRLTGDERLFQQLNYFNPPILLLFFVRSGLNFDLDALVDNSESIGATPLVVVGILYFLVRIMGKYAGAFLGCLVTKKDKKVRNFLGLALIPQAGVAIGLAATGARTLGGEVGNALETIILASSVLYELIGPACAKLSLYLSGSYSNKLEDLAPIPATEPGQPPKSEVELLIERIQAIQQELPKHNNPYYEDEQAFTEAAAEHSAQMEAFFGTPGKANTAMPGRKRK